MAEQGEAQRLRRMVANLLVAREAVLDAVGLFSKELYEAQRPEAKTVVIAHLTDCNRALSGLASLCSLLSDRATRAEVGAYAAGSHLDVRG